MADEAGTVEVVLRRARDSGPRFKLDLGLDILHDEVDGGKKVKWSDSTELREKMKEYRRSQFSMVLDYQHIAADEEREREGVKKWREIKDMLENTEEEEEEEDGDGNAPLAKEPSAVEDSGGSPTEQTVGEEDEDGLDGLPASDDSDGDDPYCDAALEAKLRVIKATASRFTVLPAYTAAVNTYESWFASRSPSTLPPDQVSLMTEQLDLYKQILAHYEEWNDSDCGEVDRIDASYKAISSKIGQAKKLVTPPQEVSESLNSVLNNETNVRKHRTTYTSLVESMVTDLSKQIQVTTL